MIFFSTFSNFNPILLPVLGVSVAGDRVMDFDNLQVESVFNKIKQSHIKIIFTYVAPIVKYLVTDDDKYLVTNDGRRIIAAMDYPE